MTVREHLEAIVARHEPLGEGSLWCKQMCGTYMPCVDRTHAVAALDEWDRLLDRLGHAERAISFNGDAKSILQQIIEAES